LKHVVLKLTLNFIRIWKLRKTSFHIYPFSVSDVHI